MRRGLGLVVAVSILASSPGSAAAPRFPTGWWQSTEVDALDGQATSFELRQTRRGRYVVRHLLTWGSNCGSGDFGDETPGSRWTGAGAFAIGSVTSRTESVPSAADCPAGAAPARLCGSGGTSLPTFLAHAG